MELLNYNLVPGPYWDDGHGMRSWQMLSLCQTFKKINLPYKICALNNTEVMVPCNSIEVTEQTIDNINKSSVDVVLYLNCDHIHSKNLEDLELLQTCKKQVIVIDHECSHLNFPSDFPSIIYHVWPTLTVQQILTPGIILPNKRQYIFSCLMNKARYERIFNILEFIDSDYWNKSLVTFNKLEPEWWSDSHVAGLKYRWPKECERFINEIVPLLPIKTNDKLSLYYGEDWSCFFEYDGIAYTDAYVNVCCETTYFSRFVSEKICKAMLAEQMWVIVGARGAVNQLRQLGFDTFDDIIDHSRYDDSDDEHRVRDIHKLLADIQHYDWEEIFEKTKVRRKYNKNKLLKFDIERKFLTELTQLIEQR